MYTVHIYAQALPSYTTTLNTEYQCKQINNHDINTKCDISFVWLEIERHTHTHTSIAVWECCNLVENQSNSLQVSLFDNLKGIEIDSIQSLANTWAFRRGITICLVACSISSHLYREKCICVYACMAAYTIVFSTFCYM